MLNAECGFTYNTDTEMTAAEMWSTYYQMTVTQLIQESLVKLCMEHVPWSDTLEIDGIVCIARGDDSKQLVVKIHQVLDVTAQKELKHLTSDSTGDVKESNINTKVECSDSSHDQLRTEDIAVARRVENDRNVDAIETHSTDTVCDVPVIQHGSDLVSVAPTTPIWKWRGSLPPCHSPVELKSEPDIDGVIEEDFAVSQPNDRQLTCKKCGTTFSSVMQLQSHTAKVHSRFMCKHCLNTFSLRCNLRRHERLHAGLKPYSCDVCTKSFARSTDLKIHIARHTIGKSSTSFSCSQCPKTFTALSSLRWHMYKTHKQQDAVHQCSVCGQVFFDRLTYQAHRKLHVNTPGDAAMDREVENVMDEGDSDGVSLCQKTDAAVTAVTVTAACPAMVSILKMNVTQRPPYNSIQEVSTCTNGDWQLDKIPVLSLPQPLSQSFPQSQSVSVFDGRAVPAVSNVTAGDSGKRILTQLLMTAVDASRSKRRKGRPVKHVVSPDVISSDMSDADMSDVSTEHPSESKCWANGIEVVDTLSRNTSLIWPEAETPQSTMTPSNNQDTKPVVCNVQSLTTPSGLQPVDTDAQAHTEVTVNAPDGDFCEPDKPADMSATERKGYICNRFNCGKVFVGFSKYELHYMEKHDRYPCHFCDNSFTGKNNRIRHEKSHTGGKSYRCKDCARMFSRPDSLREHQFTHTASYREQKCRICGATYDKKAQLLSHMKKCFRGMRIVDYSTDSVEVRLPKRGKKDDDSLLADSFTT